MSEPIWGIPPDLVVGPWFSALSAAPENWGMRATDIDALRAAGGDGENEVVAILDTGADPDHPELVGRWHADPWSDVPGEDPQDRNGHGPHCMGTACGNSPSVGVAFKAGRMSGKCLSNAGSGANTWIMASWRKAMDRGATVISASIGGPGFLRGMEPLIQEANARGIIPVLAAGNDRGRGGIADDCSGLVVGAVDPSGGFATFSNPGRQAATLAAAAPGVNIVSVRTGGGYVTMSGTSMATPFVAGVVACVQSARVKLGLPRLTTAQFRTLFNTRNLDAGSPGPDRDFGPGLVSGTALRRSLTQLPQVA